MLDWFHVKTARRQTRPVIGERRVRWTRLAALTILLFCLLGADCSDTIVNEVIPGGGDECVDGSPIAVLAMYPYQALPPAGSTVDITVRIYQGCNVAGVPFSLSTNPEHLRFVSGVVGPFLGSEGGNVSFLAGPDSSRPGVISVGASILGAGPDGELTPDGNGELCTLSFEVLPEAVIAGETTLVPFNLKVFQPGLVEQPSNFPPLILRLRIP
jgi:hypothetical protein